MAISEKELHRYLEGAVEAAYSGGKWLQHYWGGLKGFEEKSSASDLVTEADRASEAAILAVIKERFPCHAILCEESGSHGDEKGTFLWVIDPLDGTTNYVHQYPFVCVSIGLLIEGEASVSVVYNPISQELFSGVKGYGAHLNGRKIAVSKTTSLSKSLLSTGFAYDRQKNPDNNYRQFCHLTQLTQGVRRAGAAALDLSFVAAGRLDGYWEKGLQPWDVAAAVLLVTEAGGAATSYEGLPLDIFSGRVLASNGLIHNDLIKALKIDE